MDLLKLKAKISLDGDEYNKGLDDAETKAKKSGSSIGAVLGKTAAVTGAAITAAVGAAATGIGILVKQSVSAYSEYEQLTGGVETLFKDSSDKVMEYANNAYKTAGLSANEYMETVTSFSASLLQSLGGDTEAAAEYADKAITDMSDNANKMGTSMESIQNAYQGFAKQNFTMLDNLKLGYGGTKEEMERLLADAEKLSGQKFDISSYADIVEAIHVVQTEMGIAGTTAEEASSTIQGSLGMLKSSWENLVAGFANPDADLGLLINNMIDSAVVAFDNLLPAIETALSGIATAIEKIVPIISDKLPGLIEEILPSLLQATTSLIEGLVKALPSLLSVLLSELPGIMGQIVNTLIEMLPTIIETGLQIIVALANGIAEAIPNLIPTIIDVILQIVNILTDPANLTSLIEAAIAIILALTDGLIEALPKLIEALPIIMDNVATAMINNLPLLMDAVIQILAALAVALIQNAPLLIQAVIEIHLSILQTIIGYAGQFISTAVDKLKELVGKVKEGLRNMFDTFVEWLSKLPSTLAYYAGYAIASFLKFIIELPTNISNIFNSIISTVVSFGTRFVNNAIDIASRFFNSIVNGLTSLPSKMSQLGNSLVNAVINLPSKFSEIGHNIVQGIWQGISGGWQWLKDQVSNLANSLFQGAKDALDIHSPSKKFAWVGQMVDKGFAKGIDDYAYLVDNALESMTNLSKVDINTGSNNSGRIGGTYNQVINITSPQALSPYEVARQTKNATRDMVLALSI